MSSYFWQTFLSDCRFATNCKILSRDRKSKETHKLLLSAISDDLRSYLLSSSDPTEEATILLPDFSMEEIEEMFSKVFSKDGHNDLFQVLGLFQYSKAANKVKPEKPKVIESKVKSEQSQDTENNYKDEYGLLNAVEQSLNVMEELNRESHYDYYQTQTYSNFEEKPKSKKRKFKKTEVKSKTENGGDNLEESGAHICEYCDREFKSEDSLFGHVTLKHPEKHEFLQYMLEIDGEFQCTICKKTYPKRRRCNIHIRSKHKIGAKLNCEVCQQVFYFKHELELHMVKHTQAKDAYCHLCGKGVRVAANLQRHMIAFHTNKAEKEMARTFFCTTCGKGFFTSGALKEHEMLHSDAYNFQCSQCPKTFKQSAGLRTHFKRHHTNFEKTPEQKAKFAAYMQQYRARQREKDKVQPSPVNVILNSQSNQQIT